MKYIRDIRDILIITLQLMFGSFIKYIKSSYINFIKKMNKSHDYACTVIFFLSIIVTLLGINDVYAPNLGLEKRENT